MRIWALILIAYFLSAFALREDFSAVFFEVNGAWLVALLAIGLVVTAFADHIRNLMGFLSEERHHTLFALMAMFCIFGVEYVNSQQHLQSIHPTNETAAIALTGTEASINRSWDGHFRAIAEIEGADVGLMIDTGASLVLLRNDDALRVGIALDTLEFTTPLTTASGKSFVAPVLLQNLTIGELTLRNVKAAVAQEGALHSSLLGMSFLENLTETVIRKDRMILRK